jgi:hypothetical protein
VPDTFSRLPPGHQPLRNAWALGLWHEPPRIRRRSRRRGLALLALILALCGGAVAAYHHSATLAKPQLAEAAR